MATLSSNELKAGLDVYSQQAKTQGLRVLSAALSGRVQNGSMTEAEKAELIQRYTDTLAKLDEQQTTLLKEYESTGRVRLNMMSTLISSYARMTAAALTAQGTTGAATINAEAMRLGQLDNAMSREGPGLEADLGEAFKESAAGLRGFMADGKVSDPSQFGATLVSDLEKLAATNPKMVMPYIREVEGSTGVKVDQFRYCYRARRGWRPDRTAWPNLHVPPHGRAGRCGSAASWEPDRCRTAQGHGATVPKRRDPSSPQVREPDQDDLRNPWSGDWTGGVRGL